MIQIPILEYERAQCFMEADNRWPRDSLSESHIRSTKKLNGMGDMDH